MKNRALIALVTVVVAVFGTIAMSLLKLELIPSVTFPQLVVISNYPGASPVIVEKEVSTPIETAIQGVPGLESTKATSYSGVSQISVSFKYGTNIDTAQQKVEIAINNISGLLPSSVNPQVIAGSFADIPIMQLAITSDLPPDQLNQALSDIAVSELTKIDGVRAASISGANGEHVSIVPKPDVMKAKDLTTTDIQTALQTAGIRLGAGTVDSKKGELSIISGETLSSVSDIKKLPVTLPIKTKVTTPKTPTPTIPELPSIPLYPRSSGLWAWDQLNGGECITGFTSPFDYSFTVVDCATPHVAQLVRVGDIVADAEVPIYPGDAAIAGVAMGQCAKPGIINATALAADPTLLSLARYPSSQAQWNKGDTYFYCFAKRADGATFTGDVAGGILNTLESAFPSSMAGPSSFSYPTPTVSTPTSFNVTTIGEIARVSIVSNTITTVSRVNGEQSLTIAITKTADSNTVDVARAVREELPRITNLLGNGTKITTVFDQAPYIEKSIESLATEGLLGLGFAIIIILIFLLSVRSTLVTAVSIPTSLLLTFIGMWASDFTLNLLTIGAVTISIGRVVDDSIVVVENIKRHLSLGEERLEAIKTAVKEVASAVTSSTITTVAVFLPLAFVSGLAGELFKPFAVTVTLALLASLFVSLTIVPVLAYWFLREGQSRFTPKFARNRSEGSDALQNRYRPIVRWTILHPLATMLIAILTLVGTFALAPLLKTNFVGGSGQSTMTLRHSTPADLTLIDRSELSVGVEKKLMATPGVTTVQTTIDSGSAFSAFNGRATDITYQLTISDEFDVETVRGEITKQLETITDTGKVVSAQGGAFGSSTIDITIKAPSEETLVQVTDAVASAMQDSGAAENITTSLDDTQSYLSIVVDRVAAARYGLSEASIGRAIASVISPTATGQIVIDDVTYNIIIESRNEPQTVKQLKAYKLTTPFDTEIALSRIAKIVSKQTAASRTTERGVLSSTVSVTPLSDNLSETNAKVTEALASVDLPSGTTASIGGVSKDQADSFLQLGLALLAAILIVYVVMVATFRSLRQPLLLLVSIPFATTGAILLQLISGIPLGISSLIGLLMLVGIVVTNAIVLIDLVNQYRERGETVTDALLDGTARRVRPVLMTALATVFALTPLALGVTGTGGFISQPLAIIVIGGLLSSTLLTLLVLPALYSLVEGAKERRQAKRGARA